MILAASLSVKDYYSAILSKSSPPVQSLRLNKMVNDIRMTKTDVKKNYMREILTL